MSYGNGYIPYRVNINKCNDNNNYNNNNNNIVRKCPTRIKITNYNGATLSGNIHHRTFKTAQNTQ